MRSRFDAAEPKPGDTYRARNGLTREVKSVVPSKGTAVVRYIVWVDVRCDLDMVPHRRTTWLADWRAWCVRNDAELVAKAELPAPQPIHPAS